MLRGPRGTTVRLGLERQGISDLVEVEVVRGVIPIRSIESAFRIADGVGYVKLGQFARTTFDEFRKALASLRAEGVTKLIFDLRGNSGGFLDQAIAVANEFLHEGQLIVYTEDRRHEQLREYADGKGSAQDMEVVVLIDEGSASSSEILAGALQDNDRGTIIGRRSFGKGLVQRQIPYSDGSALRLTTARYYTPTGRSIQKPYTIGDDADYEEDLWNRYRNNEFFSADSIHFADSLKRVTPGGKVVYGGGGIMPDLPCRLYTTPFSSRSRNTFCVVVRLTCSISESSLSVGSLSPSTRWFCFIKSKIYSVIISCFFFGTATVLTSSPPYWYVPIFQPLFNSPIF